VAAAASETGKRAGVGNVRLTCGAKWQRQLAGLLGARASSGFLGRLAGRVRARWGWLGREAERLARRPTSSFLFFFLSFISFPLFEFKFGLEFEFKTDVTYSLEFREFCLILTLWFITLMELFGIT